MAKVTGIGGIFFKTKDTSRTKDWYQKHLGIEPDAGGYVTFRWKDKDNPEVDGSTAWSPFKEDTTYFNPSDKPYMINYRVDDLDGMLAQLREAGVQVDDKLEEDDDYGRFGWAMDVDGARIELWEPPKKKG